jgi:uncharacterized protein YcnI
MSAATGARWYSRPLSRTAIVGIATSAGVLLCAIPALAHITVTPSSAQAGSAAELTFRVPDEEAKADTVKVDVQIPTDHPIAQLLVKPVQGWTVSVKTITLAKPLVTDDGSFSQAVSEVIWSGGQIAPGQFQDFSVSADPLPEGISSLTFKAIQTYSNGDIVRWIDVSQPGTPEPDHPAPVLTLTSGTAEVPPAATSGSAASDGMVLGIAVGGLVIGLLGLAVATLSWRRGRAAVTAEPSAPAPDGDGLAITSAAATTAPRARNGSESRPAGTSAQEASRRKSASSRRTTRR